MSTSGAEKTMSVLHEENKAQATESSNARWTNFKKQSKIVALVVLAIGAVWLWRSPDSPADATSVPFVTSAAPKHTAPVAPKIIPELCKDGSGGELPQCEVIELTTSELRKTLPALACYGFNPGGREQIRVELTAKGKPTGDVLLTSALGEPTSVGIYKVKLGETINGFTCR